MSNFRMAKEIRNTRQIKDQHINPNPCSATRLSNGDR
jgi:hypothetical protein